MRTLLITAATCLSLSACFGGPDTDTDTVEMASMEAQAEEIAADLVVLVDSPLPGWDAFGEPLTSRNQVADSLGFAAIAGDPAKFDGQAMRVVGVVDEVCQTKGCWMTFTDGGSSMRVKFKDYAFFVPKDAAGRTAILDGTFAVQVVPAEEERHYLEDAGRHEEAALVTEDVERLTFMASSVLMMN